MVLSSKRGQTCGNLDCRFVCHFGVGNYFLLKTRPAFFVTRWNSFCTREAVRFKADENVSRLLSTVLYFVSIFKISRLMLSLLFLAFNQIISCLTKREKAKEKRTHGRERGTTHLLWNSVLLCWALLYCWHHRRPVGKRRNNKNGRKRQKTNDHFRAED